MGKYEGASAGGGTVSDRGGGDDGRWMTTTFEEMCWCGSGSGESVQV